MNMLKLFLFVLLFYSTSWAQVTEEPPETNRCMERVDGVLQIKSETFEKLSEIFLEVACSQSIRNCQVGQDFMSYLPTPEEIQVALAEEGLANPDAILADDSAPIPELTEEQQESAVANGLRKTRDIVSDTATRATFGSAAQTAEAGAKAIAAAGAFQLARSNFVLNIQQRTEAIRAKIRAKKLGDFVGRFSSLTTGVGSLSGGFGLVAGLIAVEALRTPKEAVYIGNCDNHMRSTTDRENTSNTGYVQREQFFTSDRRPIGECFPALHYHSGLSRFVNDVSPDRQIEILAGEDPLLCQNILDVHERMTKPRPVQITSCERGGKMRLSLEGSRFEELLGNQITITGRLWGREPRIDRVHLLGQRHTGRVCGADRVSPTSNRALLWVSPSSDRNCVARSAHECAQLWWFDERLLAHRFGSSESREELENQCIERIRGVACASDHDYESLRSQIRETNVCTGERHIANQIGLLRTLNPAINKAAICCGSRGAGATLDEQGICRSPAEDSIPGYNEEVAR